MKTLDSQFLRPRRLTRTPRFVALILLLGAAAATAHAAPPTVITSAPFVITQSGDYVLGANLVLNQKNGSIITVNASNVTLDFANHFIAGPANDPSTNLDGISSIERSNLTIKNGTIAFCKQGINIVGSGTANTNNVGIRVENMRVTKGAFIGIAVTNAPGAVIRRCQVTDIKNPSTLTTAQAAGIDLSGDGASVVDCSIGRITANNTNGTYGIFLFGGAFAARNRIAEAPIGIAGDGKYQENLFQGVTKPFEGGTDAGGNN